MEMSEIIETVRGMVRGACLREDPTPAPVVQVVKFAGWSRHTALVVKFAKQLAPQLGVDQDIAELAALLHDYAKIIDPTCSKKHHILGAQHAQEILSGFNYPQERIDLVKKSISSHSASLDIVRTTPEEVCLASADAMAHIDQFLYLLFMQCYQGKSFEEASAQIGNKMEISWKKMCPQAQELMREKYASIKVLLV